MAKDHISCNIAIYPPHLILQKAIKVSWLLKERGGLFVLDSKRYYPHVTLYMTEFPVKNLRVMIAALGRIATATHSFLLKSGRHRQHKSYVDVSFQRTVDVLRLQQSIVRAINPLREGLIRPKDSARINQFSKEKQRNILKYGYDNVHSQFLPHLTFTKLRKGSRTFLGRLPRDNFSFRAGRMALFRSTAHGTCRELIAQFKFGK